MMFRRAFLTTALASLACPVYSQEPADVVQLTAEQITEILSGNTITGTWSGTPYKQFFATGGMTMYIAEGSAPDQGRWRANAEANTYESWWQMTNWTSYRVVMTNDGYAWMNGETLEHFEVQKGKQVSW